MRQTVAIAALLASLIPSAAETRDRNAGDPERLLAAQLRQIDQGLLDAISAGDGAAWRRVVAPGFVYIAENEQAIDGPTLISLLKPPEPGDEWADAKPFRIVDYSLHLLGDAATVVHHDAEQGSHLGSRLTGSDVTTEVWQRLGGHWKLRLVHTTPIPTVPPAVTLPVSYLGDLAGRYRAGNEFVTVSATADGLTWQADGRPIQNLLTEARDVAFEPDNPRVRYIFHRDAAGKITEVLRRNENRAIAYTRSR